MIFDRFFSERQTPSSMLIMNCCCILQYNKINILTSYDINTGTNVIHNYVTMLNNFLITVFINLQIYLQLKIKTTYRVNSTSRLTFKTPSKSTPPPLAINGHDVLLNIMYAYWVLFFF